MMGEQRRWPLALAALAWCYLWFFPWFGHLNNPNEHVRLYLAKAMVDDGTISIGRRVLDSRGRASDRGGVVGEWGYVNDKALVCDDPSARPPCTGTLYMAKAPGASWVAVPSYAALKLAHGLLGSGQPPKHHVIWFARLCTALLPTLALLWWLRRSIFDATGDAHAADFGALCLGAASPAFAYGQLVTGHHLAATSLFAAFLCFVSARGVPGGKRAQRAHGTRWLLGGALTAFAVATEYTAGVPALLVGCFGLFAAGRGRRALLVVAGALPVALALAAYHSAAFGGPFSLPYDHLENQGFVRDMSKGWHGIGAPSLEQLGAVLLSPAYGMLFHSPWIFLAGPGAAVLARRRGWRASALTAAGVVVLVTLLLAAMPNLRVMLGWTVGPRYGLTLYPFAAFLAGAGVAAAIERAPGLAIPAASALVLGGALACVIPGVLYPHYPPELPNPLFDLGLPLLAEGYAPRNAGDFLGLPPRWSLALGLGPMAAALLTLASGPKAGVARGARRLGIALLLLAALLAGAAAPGHPADRRARVKAAWVRAHYEPARAPADPCVAGPRSARQGRALDALGALRTGGCRN